MSSYTPSPRLSSGLLIIDRLKKYGYVVETNDTEDKRSKRLTLTPAGLMILQNCYKQMEELGNLFFDTLSEDDMRLCIQLLKGIEIRFSDLWPKHKGNSFTAIQQDIQATVSV